MRLDDSILKRIADGDAKAFRQVFEYFYPKVLSLMCNYARRRADAEDLAQNVFVKLWTNRKSLSDIRSFDAYLFKMCRNAALDYCKRHKVFFDLDETYPEELTNALDENYIALEIQQMMYRQIASMPEKRRQVITMSRIEGKSNDEIAEALGISKKTVENHINAALHNLRKISS